MWMALGVFPYMGIVWGGPYLMCLSAYLLWGSYYLPKEVVKKKKGCKSGIMWMELGVFPYMGIVWNGPYLMCSSFLEIIPSNSRAYPESGWILWSLQRSRRKNLRVGVRKPCGTNNQPGKMRLKTMRGKNMVLNSRMRSRSL